MRKLSVLLLLFSNFIFAQIRFEKGYFIDNSNNKVEGYIKNEDKSNNPTSFYFKNNLDSKEEIKTIENIKEFNIDNFYKFERQQVKIDVSSTNISNLSSTRDPIWVTKIVFLKVLVDGEAKLYQYVNDLDRKYFYSYKNSSIEQLVYKKYLDKDNVTIKENKYFQQQLWNHIKYDNVSTKRISKIDYNQDDLTAYFEEIGLNNSPTNEGVLTPTNVKSAKNNRINVKFKSGVNFNSFSITNPIQRDKVNNLGSNTTYRIGTELEFVLPYKRNKLAVYFEPSYQTKYDVTKTIVNVYEYNLTQKYVWQMNYSSLDLTIGGKYKSFLTDSSSLFYNLGATYNWTKDSHIIIDGKPTYPISSNYSFTFGLGFEYKKVSIEARINNREIVNNNTLVDKYKNLSFVLGYKIFDSNKKK